MRAFNYFLKISDSADGKPNAIVSRAHGVVPAVFHMIVGHCNVPASPAQHTEGRAQRLRFTLDDVSDEHQRKGEALRIAALEEDFNAIRDVVSAAFEVMYFAHLGVVVN